MEMIDVNNDTHDNGYTLGVRFNGHMINNHTRNMLSRIKVESKKIKPCIKWKHICKWESNQKEMNSKFTINWD